MNNHFKGHRIYQNGFSQVLLFVLSGAAMVGCSSLQDSWIEAHCNPEAAAAAGLDDAEKGRELDDSDYARLCGSRAGECVDAYQKAYQSVSR